MSDIRVTYTGLLSFVIALLSVIFGMIFSLVLTRQLSTEEYGTWGLISGLLFYVSMLAPMITFWATRNTSRGIESGKTAVLGSSFLACISIGIYILVSYFMSDQVDTDQNILILSAILVPAIFFNGIFSAINLGWKPHTVSYGTFSFVISQVVFVIIFVFYLDLGIIGVIFANLFSYFISNTLLFVFAHEKLRNNFNKNFIKKWFSLAWLPLYPSLSIVIDSLGIIVFTLITGSVIGLAFWTVAVIIASIISHSELISRAIYPKLLQGGNRNYLQHNISQLFYFSLLMTGFVIVFAKPALFAMNPIYEPVVMVVVIIALNNFFRVITNISILNLSGIETIDIDEKATFRNYLHSKLFYPYSIKLLQTSISIVVLTIGLILLINFNVQGHDLLIFWALVYLTSQIPLSLYLFIMMKNKLEIKFDLIVILKYLAITIFSFGITFIITENFLEYDDEVIVFVPNLLFFVALGISIHIIISYVVDSSIRQLIYDIVKEMKNKHSKL
jgi:hypothetical protein